MSFFATCAGLQIVSGSLLIPKVGAWTADLELAGTGAVGSKVAIVIGNLTLTGTAIRAEAYGGQTKARLVGGAGGWRGSIQPQGYGSTSGVKLSALLGDAAQAAGETVNVPNDTTIGNGYARCSFATSVAGDILWHMIDLGFIPAWYVDAAGTTQVQDWPATTISGAVHGDAQRLTRAWSRSPPRTTPRWMPGCSASPRRSCSGSFTSAGVHYIWDPGGKFRFEVLTQTSPTDTGDRVLGPIQQVIQKETAPTRLFGRYQYTTSNPSATTIDASPKNTKLGLPELQNVPLQISGSSKVTPPSGVDCTIEFLDGYLPVCTWVDQTPTEVDVASGTNPAGYLGAQVQVFFPPVVPFVSTPPGTPTAGTFTIPSPLTGIITQGSSVVKVPS